MPPLPPPLNRQSMKIAHSPVCHLQCILKLEISLAIFIADISQLTQLDIFTFLGSFYGLCVIPGVAKGAKILRASPLGSRGVVAGTVALVDSLAVKIFLHMVLHDC